jgi:hypothetical protein
MSSITSLDVIGSVDTASPQDITLNGDEKGHNNGNHVETKQEPIVVEHKMEELDAPVLRPNNSSEGLANLDVSQIDFSTMGPADFEKIKLLGRGDVGKVYLVRLKGTEKLFAMKVLRKEEMIQRNKVSTLHFLSNIAG